MGGWSAEREVSLNSGKACADAPRQAGYHVTRVDVDREIAATLARAQAGCRAQCAARPPGEDGTLQGMLEILGIPYSHSGVLASARRDAEGSGEVDAQRRRRAGAAAA